MRKYYPPRSPVTGKFSKQSLESRFWQKVDSTSTPTGCWPWQGSRDEDGYGVFTMPPKPYRRIRAHRLAIMLATGIDRQEQKVRHACDNPSCCRPEHLSYGTPADNTHDAVARHRMAHGETHGKTSLTQKDVEAIREYAATMSQRALAIIFGVSHRTISNIINRKTWKYS